jgi:hypothetical protein
MSPNPTDLHFDTDGWAEGTSPDGPTIFARPPDDLLIAEAFDVPPDLPFHDMQALYQHMSAPLAEMGGTMVSLGALTIDGVPSLEMIFSAPETALGPVYVGVLTIPFRDRSYAIKVMCRDSGSDELPLERLRDHLDRLSETTTLSESAKQAPRFGT